VQQWISEANMNRAKFHVTLVEIVSALAVLSFSSPGLCLEPKKVEAAAAKQPDSKNSMQPASGDSKPQMTDVQKFCLNNATSAGDARAAWQAAKLMELEEQIKQRIAELDAKRAEYEEWLKKRDEAMKKAEDGVVAIYSKMRPEAAASQLSAMDDVMAATLLARLPTKNASLILNEIEPGRAARLTNTMTGMGASSDGKKS
jgi:flagellar motility protein MotE (MotC chaperone)